MQLNNLALLNGIHPVNISTRGEKLATIDNTPACDEAGIFFTNALALPGLINSHDHLDFNCFSPLGERRYNSYLEWGHHIHIDYKKQIEAVLKIPAVLRIRWGMYKNLLAGVTTAINHGSLLPVQDPLINIYQQTQNLHSVGFQQKWKWKLNNPLQHRKICVIHTGEGTDQASVAEIDALLKWNLLNRKLVGIHGVAMNAKQAKKMTGLVWCPESNQLLLNRHADIRNLQQHTRVVFGTDSTLTGHWNIWQHLRLAKSLQLVSDEELLGMVTSRPALLWGFNNGYLQPGKDADMVIVNPKQTTCGGPDLFATNPEDILLVMHRGHIRLFDETLAPQLQKRASGPAGFYPVALHNGSIKFVDGNLPLLAAAIRKYYPEMNFPFEK